MGAHSEGFWAVIQLGAGLQQPLSTVQAALHPGWVSSFWKEVLRSSPER